MSETLTSLTAKLQALLLDDGTLFASNTCTAAIRQGLKDFNLRAPVHAAATLDAVSGRYVYELTESLAGAMPAFVTAVLRADASGGDDDVPLGFRSYNEDERWFVRLDAPESDGTGLILQFVQPHTIDGLDEATETTLTDEAIPVLLDGAAAAACRMAAAGKAEANNVDVNVPETYRKAALSFEHAFHIGLDTFASRHQPPVAQARTAAWNDAWHAWNT
jgi:hypothetical protein